MVLSLVLDFSFDLIDVPGMMAGLTGLMNLVVKVAKHSPVLLDLTISFFLSGHRSEFNAHYHFYNHLLVEGWRAGKKLSGLVLQLL